MIRSVHLVPSFDQIKRTYLIKNFPWLGKSKIRWSCVRRKLLRRNPIRMRKKKKKVGKELNRNGERLVYI